ncbi:MAG: YdeI/OmpD-associated family protein [Actinomycetota bacterium]|nr:YdeI/OmpD-associated family protein [Actinomycetota bacterium]
MAVDRPILRFSTPAEVESWFAENHATSEGILVTFSKKGAPIQLPTYDEVVAVGLRYGWIDSQLKGLDENHFLLTYTPRRARSPWSQVNREKAEAMISAGTMKPAGLAAVEQAKANGRWEAAYAGSADFETPQDFLDALKLNPTAAAFYETLTRQNKYAVYFRLNDAKKPETRARRIVKFVEMFERGEKLY